jgi:hypothetical protein
MTLQELYDKYADDPELELALVDGNGDLHYIGASAGHFVVYDDDGCLRRRRMLQRYCI